MPRRCRSHCDGATGATDREAAAGAGQRLRRGVLRVPGLCPTPRHHALRARLLPPLHHAGHQHGAGTAAQPALVNDTAGPQQLELPCSTRCLCSSHVPLGTGTLPPLPTRDQNQRAGGVPTGAAGGGGRGELPELGSKRQGRKKY